jgi:predicted transcriptional regulator
MNLLMLLQAGLMSRDESQNNAPVITRSGFQFLLMERSSQVQYNLSSGI